MAALSVHSFSLIFYFPLVHLMREAQEDYYLVLFIFASQLYFYVLGLSSLLGY